MCPQKEFYLSAHTYLWVLMAETWVPAISAGIAVVFEPIWVCIPAHPMRIAAETCKGSFMNTIGYRSSEIDQARHDPSSLTVRPFAALEP